MYLFELQAFADMRIPARNIFVVPADLLPSSFRLPAGFIINLSPSTHPGTHWVSLWIDERGCATYFDSYGFPPRTREIKSFIRLHCKKLISSPSQCQQLQSKVCGYYAACHLFYASQGVEVKIFLGKFCKNLKLNDMLIKKMYRSILGSL